MECTAAHLEKTFPRPYQIGLGEEHFPFKNRLSAIGFLHMANKLCLPKPESIPSDVKIKVLLSKNSPSGTIKAFHLSKLCVLIEDSGVDS